MNWLNGVAGLGRKKQFTPALRCSCTSWSKRKSMLVVKPVAKKVVWTLASAEGEVAGQGSRRKARWSSDGLGERGL
ncbi:hypothetical protein CDL15_Pgr011813 [Punica granatum]|uniref:Uncharacterized protein n=1 Tax=Punica granatum TaxID=22663 RepID=A0A218XF73_PUNGR|nr:hypothetical protein CDL15_Pgr011813 [Punica granatum]PKI44356.1 hypothetical protein CRG98_035267 [Punica granatum]